MSLEDEMLKQMLSDDSPTIDQQIEQAEVKAGEGRNLYWRDMGSALYDWAKGAVAGAEEIGRAASSRGANVPADYLDEQALETPELTPEQQQSEDWYQKAVDKFNEETTQPLMVAAALSGIPGVSQFGLMGMMPMLAKDLERNVEKEGVVSGTTSTLLNMAPFVGSYRMASDPNFQKFAEVHPGRASGLLVMNEAPWLATGIQISKLVNREALLKKFKGNMEKALEYEKKLKAKENLEKGKAEKVATAEAAAKDTEVKANKSTDTEFKPEKPRDIAEEVDMTNNPKVAKDIDDTFVNSQIAKETADFEANRVHRGAYDTDIEAIPPTNTDLGRVTINKIWETANRIVPSRIGNMITKSKMVLGHFRPLQKVVNVRDTLNLDTLAHEVGHYIDGVLKIQGFDKELVDAAKSVWKNGQYKKHEWRGEGIAEFMTEYVLNPDMAKQNFPGYYEAFVKAIAEHPEMAAELETLCQQVRTWRHMQPEERVRGNMVFDGDVQKTAMQRIKDTFDNIRNAWQDEHASLKEAVTDFVDSVGITLLQSEDPALNAAAVKSWIPARATLMLGFFSNVVDEFAISALEKTYQIPLKKITLGTIYGKLRDLNLNKDVLKYYKDRGFSNIHEAFAAYSLATHALDVIPVKNAERIAGLKEKLLGYQQQLLKMNPVEVVNEEIRTLMYEISSANPKDTAKLESLRKRVSEKIELRKTLEKQTRSEKELKAIEALKKKIAKKEAEIDAIKNGLDDYKTFADKADLQSLVDNAPAEFKELLQNLSDVTENYMALAVHFGFVTAEEAKNLRKQYPHYVPMHRDFSIDRLVVNPGGGSGGGGKGGYVDVTSPIRALKEKGSTRTVLDPISELYKATQKLIDAGERNKVGQAFAKLAKLDKAGQIIVETMDNPSSAKGTFAVWIDGKQKFYQAMVPGLYEAITGNSHAAASYACDAVTSILRKGASALRIGATSTPMFMIWNGFRDTFAASFYSQTGMAPIKGTIDGFMLRKDQQLMADFLSQGVPFATFIGSNKDIMSMFMSKIKTKTTKDKTLDILKMPFKAFEAVNEATEQAPRLAEFKRTYDQLLRQGFTEQEALFVAGNRARELTVNFSKMGTSVRTLNQYAAFLNAAIQGNVKVVKALGDDVVRTARIFYEIRQGKLHPKTEAQKTWNAWRNGEINWIEAVKKAPMGTTLWGLTEIALPSMILWGINHNKDWYKNLSYDEKMKNWFLEVSDGIILRFPKPETLGYMLGSVPERILDYAYDQDPKALLMSSAGKFMLEAFAPEVTPTALLPIYEWRGNINFFRDRPIEDAKAQGYLEEDRYDIYTSEMAKYAGKTLGLSPMKIDNSFRDVTGSLGSFFLGASDMVFKDKKLPAKDWRDMTRLTYNPTPNSRSRTAEVFYADSEKLAQKFKSDSLRGKTKKPRELKIYEQAKKALVPKYKEQKMITNGTGKYATMTPEERGKARDKIRIEIDKIQRDANNKAGFKYVPNLK